MSAAPPGPTPSAFGAPTGDRSGAWSADRSWSGRTVTANRGGYARNAWRPVPRSGLLPMRQLGFFEALDLALRAVRERPRVVLGVPALVTGLLTIVTALLGAFLVWVLFSGGDALLDDPDAMLGINLMANGMSTIAGLLTYALAMFFAGTAAPAIHAAIFRDRLDLAGTWAALAGSRRRLLGLTALFGTAQVLLLLVLFVPAILGTLLGGVVPGILLGMVGLLLWIAVFLFSYVRFTPAAPALVVERLGVFAALRRSWELTGRGFWRITGIQALGAFLVSQIVGLIIVPPMYALFVVAVILMFTMTSPLAIMVIVIAFGVLVAALVVLASSLQLAYLSALVMVVYVDQRMRLEGYDITLLDEAEQRLEAAA